MSKKVYSNVLRSRQAIEGALIALLTAGHELDDISVSELAEKAGVSRGTFYNHFGTVDDVLQGIENNFMDSLSQALISTELKSEEDRKAFFDQIGNFLSLHGKDALAIWKYLPIRTFLDLKSKLNKTIATTLKSKVGDIPIQDDFVKKIHFFVSGLIGRYVDSLTSGNPLDVAAASKFCYEVSNLLFAPEIKQQQISQRL